MKEERIDRQHHVHDTNQHCQISKTKRSTSSTSPKNKR